MGDDILMSWMYLIIINIYLGLYVLGRERESCEKTARTDLLGAIRLLPGVAERRDAGR